MSLTEVPSGEHALEQGHDVIWYIFKDYSVSRLRNVSN